MNYKNIKTYPLSEGKFVVSYYDPAKSKRVIKNFTSEGDAKVYVSKIKTPEPVTHDLSYLKNASTETAVRIYLEHFPKSSLAKSPRLKREFIEFFTVLGIPRLNEARLTEFFVHLKNEHNHGDRTLLVKKGILSGFFKFLIDQGAIETSPLAGIKFNRGAPYARKPKVFSKGELKYFLETAKKYSPVTVYPMFLLIAETAAKKNDLLNLLWKDINFKTSTITFVRSPELQPRSFQISNLLLEQLRKMEHLSENVFVNLHNKPYLRHSIGKELKRFQRAAGLSTEWNFIDLRFSFGINFLKDGGTYAELQKIMGHKSKYNTEEIFGRYERLSSNLSGPTAVQETREVSRS